MDLSIVIPTLNEEDYIVKTLETIHEKKSGQLSLEIILIDADSEDNTLKNARPYVDKIFAKGELRGAKFKSLNKGGQMAVGGVILFLDADSLVPRNFDLLIRENLKHPEILGGAFEFQMDGKGIVYRLIEWINRIRYRLDQRYFGDQGLFCEKEAFNQLGGYPDQPIMEAAYFCKRLKSLGALTLIKSRIITSARRFEKGNVWRVLMQDTWIWIQFTLGLNIHRFAPDYWKENENRLK